MDRAVVHAPPDERMGIVYYLWFPVPGKGYVGQTRRPLEQRVREHTSERSRCVAVRNAIRKYGTAGFHASVLKRVPVDQLDYWEHHFITAVGTLAPRGYNVMPVGAYPPPAPPLAPVAPVAAAPAPVAAPVAPAAAPVAPTAAPVAFSRFAMAPAAAAMAAPATAECAAPAAARVPEWRRACPLVPCIKFAPAKHAARRAR